MAIVKFDVNEFFEAYPQFKGAVTEAQAMQAFKVACVMLDNTEHSPVPYDPDNGVYTREVLFFLLVCHLLSLAQRPSTQSGPIASATQGSVSISYSVPQSQNGQYYMQTPCGESYWDAIRKFIVGGRYYDTNKYHPWG